MFYDLNVPWTSNTSNLPKTLAFLHEVGYNVVALNHTITGKLPVDPKNPIPNFLQAEGLPEKLTVLRRVTLVLTDSHQNARLAALAKEYDLLALRPVDERSLQLACSSLECDLISLDLTQRFSFFFRHKMFVEAVRAGKRFEICYSQGLLGDAQARRNLITNATQLIRASRGRGLVLSSETKAGAIGIRGPWDVVNLSVIWGLGQERGYEAVSAEARKVVVSAGLKRTGYRGVVDVVYGGEKPAAIGNEESSKMEKQTKTGQGKKRKADAVDDGKEDGHENNTEAPISKREVKRRAKQARENASQADNNGEVAAMDSISKTAPENGG